MLDNSKTRCKPRYRLLTKEQIKQIHLASLEILNTIGVKVSHKEGIKLLEEGADTGKGIVEGFKGLLNPENRITILFKLTDGQFENAKIKIKDSAYG